MSDFRVLHKKRIPRRAPASFTLALLAYFKAFDLLDQYHFWVAGFLTIVWMIWFAVWMNQKHVDPFDN